jgi:acyl-CoA dehydrogenase
LRRAAETISAFGADPDLLTALADLEIRVSAFKQFEFATMEQGPAQSGNEMKPSVLKLLGSELRQRISELALAAMGPLAQAAGHGSTDEAGVLGSQVVGSFLSLRAATIYSGTSETQRNQISRWLMASADGGRTDQTKGE